MASKETSALTAAAALDGSELVAIVQGGNSRKATAAGISAGAAGLVTGTPGTGSATPTTPARGFSRASRLLSAQFGLFLYTDGSAWELSYGYFNGTTITRPAGGFVASSTGSQLSLTSAATVALVADGWLSLDRRECNRGLTYYGAGGAPYEIGVNTGSANGTLAASNLASTNILTKQARSKFTSATTANALGGVSCNTGGTAGHMMRSTTAGTGGFHLYALWGASQLPTGPRLFVGAVDTGYSTADPSTIVANFAGFSKDEADTNIQFLTNDASGSGNKTDTGIAWAANNWYETHVFCAPGATSVQGVICDWGNGVVFYTSTTSNLPVDNANMGLMVRGGLNGTNTGTAIIVEVGALMSKAGQ